MAKEFRNQGLPGGSPGGPITLALPALQPTPVEGCGICTTVAQEREAAWRRGDKSAASDANVKLRNHRYHAS